MPHRKGLSFGYMHATVLINISEESYSLWSSFEILINSVACLITELMSFCEASAKPNIVIQ